VFHLRKYVSTRVAVNLYSIPQISGICLQSSPKISLDRTDSRRVFYRSRYNKAFAAEFGRVEGPMPTMTQVKAIYKRELVQRAPEKMTRAGDNWPAQFQGFFFPGNEDVVDQCALSVLKQSLAVDGRTATEAARKQVRNTIGLTTVTDKAVGIVFLTCFIPPKG
jgi:hypothetical protein